MKLKTLLFLFSILIVFTSYGQDKTLSVKFNHMVNGEELELNKTIFTIHNGKSVKLTRAEFYLSGFSLFTSNTDSFNIFESYVLVNANNRDRIHTVGKFPEALDFRKMKMDCGIDMAKNHADPTLYPETHPLGLKDPSMHWGWAAGYRFMAIEGLVDNNGDGIPEQEFQIHSLGDALLFRALLDMTGSHHVENEPLIINLDYTKLFSNLTMSGNLIQHGSAAINKTMMTNTAKGGFMSPLFISSIGNVAFESVAKVIQNNKEVMIYFNKKSGDKFVNIYNTSGQLLQNTSTKEDYLSLSLTTFSQGCYFIGITADNQTLSKQIFIY